MRVGCFHARLTTMCALAVVLVGMCGRARAQDIPSEQREAAQRAFAEGATYYIWYEAKEPVVLTQQKLGAISGTNVGGQSIGFVQVEFRYLAASESVRPPYRILTSVSASRPDGTPARMSTVSQEPSQPQTISGKDMTVFGTDGSALSGEGYLDVVLLEAPGKKAKAKGRQKGAVEHSHLSNTLRVRLLCQDK